MNNTEFTEVMVFISVLCCCVFGLILTGVL